jgi:lipoyl synthase
MNQGAANSVSRYLEIVDRQGPESFAATLSVQTNLLEAKIHDSEMPDLLLFVEHEPTYTVGRGVGFQKIQDSFCADVPWFEIARGGKATFHGPGQLVIYPIFDLSRHGKDVHLYLRKLEEAGLAALQHFGVVARTIVGQTGIWVDCKNGETTVAKKIGSIGIGVKRWIAYHGLAINITTDLRYFQAIDACGQSGDVATSLQEILGFEPDINLFKNAFVEAVKNSFSVLLVDEVPVEEQQLSPVSKRRARPQWLKVKAPGSPDFNKTLNIVRELKLNTVCEEAQCPNIGECWTHSSATFMIMGDLCTRRCSFCAVKDGSLNDLQPLDPLEPVRCAQAVEKLNLKHVVITSVNRDDLPDMGALHFHKTVKAISHLVPSCDIELLIPDMRGKRELLEMILQSNLVKVLNHNIETVPSLYKEVRPGANLQRSLNILKWAKEIQPTLRSKSGIMVGLGETKQEVLDVMDALRAHGVEVLTIGQYLQPSQKQLPIIRYVTPEEFDIYKEEGMKKGFIHVESGPLVRSSYHAWTHVGN